MKKQHKRPDKFRKSRLHPQLPLRAVLSFFLCAFLLSASGCTGIQPSGSGSVSSGDEGNTLQDISGTVKVHFIDVGQGDSILIQSGKECMLVDAGTNETGTEVVRYLKSLGISRLAYLIGTHPHEDHIGGLDDVIHSFDIGTVIMPDVSHTTRTYEDVLDALIDKDLKVTKPVPGTVYHLGEASFTILSPTEEVEQQAAAAGDLNNLSVGLRLTFGANAFVMCGDAETLSEEAIVESGLTLKADVLKLGHHGSSTSTCDSFLQAVSPSIAVVSCGKDNSYGHPHRETMDKLAAEGITVYRTDEQGTLTATSDGSVITWNTGSGASADTGILSDESASEGKTIADSNSYVLNKNSMKFHLPDCSSVEKMKESNKIYFGGSRDEVIGMGYAPCSQCNP